MLKIRQKVSLGSSTGAGQNKRYTVCASSPMPFHSKYVKSRMLVLFFINAFHAEACREVVVSLATNGSVGAFMRLLLDIIIPMSSNNTSCIQTAVSHCKRVGRTQVHFTKRSENFFIPKSSVRIYWKVEQIVSREYVVRELKHSTTYSSSK